MRSFGGTWIAAAFSEIDRELARANPGGIDVDGGYRLEMLDIPPDIHREHYELISVRHLGLLFHYLLALPFGSSYDAAFLRAWESYRRVNQLFAEALARHAGGMPILVQDFHLILVGQELRALRQRQGTPLLYFHHVPWCDPQYFGLLPSGIRDEILKALLAFDVVGFHSSRWSQAFVACCEHFLPGSRCTDEEVSWNGRSVRIVAQPASMDVPWVRAVATSPSAESWLARFETMRKDRRVLVRVDRADLWKNIVRGFEAFEAFLDRRPDLVKRLWFLAIASPTRSYLPEYRSYLRRCAATARRINERFAGKRSVVEGPISFLVGAEGRPDHARALAALRLADYAMVNPLFDGLNVVALETAAVSERDAVLILSRNAGAYERLRRGAIGVNPLDLAETASAIEQAVGMSAGERAARGHELRRAVENATPQRWVQAQLAALE